MSRKFLKQRTGIVSIVAVAIGLFMHYNGATETEIGMILTPFLAYIGKQGYVDAKENSSAIYDVIEVLDGNDESSSG